MNTVNKDLDYLFFLLRCCFRADGLRLRRTIPQTGPRAAGPTIL
jgi:hypothetical protein